MWIWAATGCRPLVLRSEDLLRAPESEIGAFCEAVGLDYVSASPYRVPIARLAAAQAALG